ncbi:hypothetical protein [Natronobacterium texcoconense]|uniref:Uncharacterized protein n=1 Tax=Natronobacterium texcoconense TaxID=1095778 RepID=A0A1H1CK32_NATTX|nr:hypothetical protein [Natronobacterium texcoconense]SDQ64513.1 hypothetical protein SAMN04489842_1433 [Natronobacterium texcoconense]
MSLFERLGEKVERVKQEAETARDEMVEDEDDPAAETDGESESETDSDADLEYRCLECDAGFPDEQEACPNCGGTAVVFDG